MYLRPNPVFESDSPYWQLVQNEYYVRDVSGKEIAIYDGSNLQQWNVWGLDNAGEINTGGSRFFYLKDHLGSIRAVIDATNSVVSAQDGACPALACPSTGGKAGAAESRFIRGTF